MSSSQTSTSTTRRININRLHIHLRGVSPSQARSLVDGLGEEILRQLAREGPIPPTPTASSGTRSGFPEGKGERGQARPTATSATSRTVTVNEIRVSAPVNGVAQAVARAVTDRTKAER